eukprot:8268190-Alexandrium_andersonii.AAC.1
MHAHVGKEGAGHSAAHTCLTTSLRELTVDRDPRHSRANNQTCSCDPCHMQCRSMQLAKHRAAVPNSCN